MKLTGANCCRFRSGVDDGIDVMQALRQGVARGVKYSVKRLAGRKGACSTGGIAMSFSDDIVTVVFVTAGHALACEGVGGIITFKLGTELARWAGAGIGHHARRPKAELAANKKLESERVRRWRVGKVSSLKECTCSSAGDMVKSGSVVVRGSE
jgi:hypothetical protein